MKVKRFALIVLTCLFMLPAVSMAETFTGSLSSGGATGNYDGEIIATGAWGNNDSIPTTIEWWVTQDADIWHYSYRLTTNVGAFSHFILETSPRFGEKQGDFTNVQVNGNSSYNAWSIGDFFTTSPSNPYMPADIHGVKFDSLSALIVNVSFDSQRAPIWGDFYAKDGRADSPGKIFNAGWNEGFVDIDPIAPISSGSVNNHILVPDTCITPPSIPEATTMMLSGMGMAGMISGIRLRRFGKLKK